ncbi:MAG TPA: ABC transporter permease [Stellaceae bacterium]|nr:ABC transporter permease [Stellaceae bacterium]
MRRIAGLVRKEGKQVLRDPSALLIAVGLPLLFLFMFGYGVSFDLRRTAICVVTEQPVPVVASLAAGLADSPYFDVRRVPDRRLCEPDLVAGRIAGMVVVSADFAARLARGEAAPIQAIVDGSDPNTAALVQNYLDAAIANWQAQETLAAGGLRQANSPQSRVWFNQEIDSRHFLLPGLVAIVMALIGTMLTALVVAREWERGTMEAMLSTPAAIGELILGKLIPYFALGMAGMAVSVACAVFLFGVPFRGSVLILIGTSSVFLIAMLGLGLMISTLARSQFVASQAAIVGTFLPALLLSGLLFEIESMPWPIQWLTRILPARYFVQILQTLFLTGNTARIILPGTLAMAAIGAAYFAVVVRNTRTRLD